MRFETAEGRAGTHRRRPRARLALLGGVLLVVYTSFILLAAVWADPRRKFQQRTLELGASGERGAREAVSAGSANWLRAMIQGPKVPELRLDIKLPAVQKLEQKRQAAIARDVLIQSPDDYVPAVIRSEGRSVRVKLRLKGDWTDHLQGDKWSLRVHVGGDDHVLGMRRFSLQHPRTRGYQAEFLFFDALKREGVLVPRYSLAQVTINGRSIGLMAVEEHFSKELLESQARRESVIIRFEEDLVWSSQDGVVWGFDGAFDNFANATISAFRATKVEQSERLSADADVAIGLLRAFVEGELPASAVFDPGTMGRFLAVAEVWGTVHAVRWHNLRFYYDPVTARLEPIGFDADAPQIIPPDERLSESEPFVAAVLEDREIRSLYDEAVLRIAREFGDAKRLQELEDLESDVLAILYREFPLVQRFTIEKVIERSAALTRRADAAPARAPSYGALIRAYVIRGEGGPYLELMNAVPEAVEIREVRFVESVGGEERESAPIDGFPRQLEGTPRGGRPSPVRVPLDAQASAGSQRLEVVAVLAGEDDVYVATAEPYREPMKGSPIPSSTLEQALARHPFLRVGDARDRLRVEAGSWEVDGSLVLPRGTSLVVRAGTTLRFHAGAALIARGAVQLEGSEEAPVILEPTSGDGWKGVFVQDARARSTWSHAIVRGTTGVGFGAWRLTGGVTFYRSEVHLDRCVFDGSMTEDALNIVRSPFEMSGVVLRDTISDGLDVDFSDGIIRGGSFERIGRAGGGDAIDVSGSAVHVAGTEIRGVADKGLSVGEGSDVISENLVIRDTGTGAASKDGSHLRISDSSIQETRTAALMAYAKKPEYGPATITAARLETGSQALVARAQLGSAISVDGVDVDAEEIDIDALYRTTMRSGTK
jgi:hypothetical protein